MRNGPRPGYSGSKSAGAVGPPPNPGMSSTKLRSFGGGATRDTDTGKYDYEGALSPAVLREFAGYMHKHRQLPDGSTRGSDNWQAGMPRPVYMQSLLRHVFDLWLIHRGVDATRPEDGSVVTVDDALGGILFNVQGYWLETLKDTTCPTS